MFNVCKSTVSEFPECKGLIGISDRISCKASSGKGKDCKGILV